MADIKKMKRWFKLNHSKKSVQFDTSRQNPDSLDSRPPPRSVTPSFPLQSSGRPSATGTPQSSGRVTRSSTPTFPLESNAVRDFYVGMDSSGPQTPSSDFSSMVRNRTPNGSLASYYLETNEPSPRSNTGSMPTPRSRTGSPLRKPLKHEPRFTSENMDTNIRGRNHGYYIKAAGLNENEGNKENLKLIYDRSRINSNSASRYTSNFASRSGSFRTNTGQRLYRPKKRPAPRPPGPSNGQNHSRQHSLDSRSSNGEVAMKVFRKKKKAPTPPPINKTWVEPQVYPIEPPVDYNKGEEKIESSEDEDVQMETEMVPKLDLNDINNDVEDNNDQQPAFEIVNVIPPPPPLPPPVHGTPSSARSNSPIPPPVPPKMDDIDAEPVAEKPKKSPSDLPRIGSILRKDIVKAAQERMNKNDNKNIENEIQQSQFQSSHQEFADELETAYKKRKARIDKSTLIVRHISSSKMYKASSPPISPRTPVDELLEKAQVKAKFLAAEEKARQKLRQSAKIEPHEWIPDHDLDEVFNADLPTEHMTARGGNYYDIANPSDENHNLVTDSSQALYKKNKYAKPNRKSGNLEKLRKSIGKAFGSIKGLNKKTSEENAKKTYSPEEGWQILYNEECDPPPSGAVKIKRMEKQSAYAYNSKTGQLVFLPEFDRIIITQDGRRIRETELNKGNKSAMNKSMPSFGRKERPSLEGLFESTVSLHSHKAEDERKQIEMMEQQFAQVRNINKTIRHSETVNDTTEDMFRKGKAWKSTPDLVSVSHELLDDGVLSDTDLPLRTSSIRDYDREKLSRAKSSERISSSKRKKKSKPKRSSGGSDPKSPRQKVLQKGMDYYIRSRPTTPNPMYSSDDDDEGYDRATSDPTSSDASSKQKSDSFGDSGIGPESLNSSASTASGAPLAAQMQQSFNGIPMNGMQGQVFYTAMPGGSQIPMGTPVVLTPGGFQPVMLSNNNTPGGHNPFVYQTMYYPSTLPHGSTMPNAAAYAMTDNKYNTMPAPGALRNKTVPENLITNSDSNSTLVASNSELNSTLKSSENKSSSKVISVTPNIALVSYTNPQTDTGANKNSDDKPADNSNTKSEQAVEDDFQYQLKKQYIVGPVGYRPVKFNPNANTKPVSLPEKRAMDNNGNKVEDNSDTSNTQEEASKPTDEEVAENEESNNNNNDKSVNTSTDDKENNNDNDDGSVKPENEHLDNDTTKNTEEKETGTSDAKQGSGEKGSEENNNIKSGSSEIPAEIQEKYGHEDLIYL